MDPTVVTLVESIHQMTDIHHPQEVVLDLRATLNVRDTVKLRPGAAVRIGLLEEVPGDEIVGLRDLLLDLVSWHRNGQRQTQHQLLKIKASNLLNNNRT